MDGLDGWMWTQRILFSLQVCVNEAASFDDGGCWKSWKRFAGMNSHRTKFGSSIINRKVCKLVSCLPKLM